MKSLVCLLIFACQLGWAQSTVVAEVAGKKITLDEFNRKYKEILDIVSTTGGPAPTKTEFLEDLIRYELGLAEAEKKSLSKDPVVIDRFKQEMYKVLLEKELGEKAQKIQVSESEMKSWYAKNPSVRWRNILIEVKPGATPQQKAEAKKRASEIYSEVRSSKRPFEELVRLYSDDTLSKQFGGDSGWQSPVTVMPQIYEPVRNAKVGQIIGPLETLYGFHILKVTEKASFQQANRVQIRQAVFNEKRLKLLDNYFSSLKKRYPVKSNPSAIK